MAATAIDDAKRFLFLHPHSTTDLDNPVELLRGVVDEFDNDLAEKLEEEREGEKADVEERAEALVDSARDRLLAFIKGLRDDMKICEAEYRTALSLAELKADAE